MQYIHLNDDSYILHTSKGMTTLNRKSFNFNRIKSLISKGADEESVLPLLQTPKLPNGLFELYLHRDSDTMLFKNISLDNEVTWHRVNNVEEVLDGGMEFMGVYASEQDIMADWPEYCL